MSTYIIQDQKVYVAHYDLTSYLDSVTIGGQKAAVAATALGATTELMKPGLETINFSYTGFFDGPDGADEIHEYLTNHATPAATPPPFAVCPTTGADGELAMMHCGRDLNYDFGGAVGSMLKISASGGAAADKLVRGYVMIPKAAYTASDVGTSAELGAALVTQRVYAALHVFTVTGTDPTLDVIVESDADDAWGAGNTTRITFTQATAASSQWKKSAVGAITDTFWRVGYTIGGTDTPTFTFAVMVGIR